MAEGDDWNGYNERLFIFPTMGDKIESIIRERYGGILPRGALQTIADEVGVSRQYVWKIAVDFAQADVEKDAKRRRCAEEDCDKYARGKSPWCSIHINVRLICHSCGALFSRRRSVHRMKMLSPLWAGKSYCDKVCYGRYLGRVYGFQPQDKE